MYAHAVVTRRCKEGAAEENFSSAMDLTEKTTDLGVEKLCTGETCNREKTTAVAEGDKQFGRSFIADNRLAT